ncbi:hypothetical protein ASG98_00050 [Bacillus sp. Soil531]|nr:hypothetical protein ASG98_00050 [Bacillus sp. Soil531]
MILKHQIKFTVKAIISKKDNKKYVVIVLKDKSTNISIIHPISDFILTNWKQSSFNTQRSHAYNTIKFLNFIYSKEKTYNLNSLTNLTYEHGTEFLNFLTYEEDKSKDTVKRFEKTLIKFYDYLFDREVIPSYSIKRFNIDQENNYISSPFRNVHFAHKKRKDTLHLIPEPYIFLFLELAFQLQPRIALGVYMQFFGGLRTGELVNLRVMDIKTLGPYAQDGILADLETRILNSNSISTSGNDFVKKPRVQLIYGYKDLLKAFYKQHMNNIYTINGTEPLFQNKQQQPLTGSMYRYYFNNLKDQFLKHLRNSTNVKDNINALALENVRWSTHIGRGIFSNLLAEQATNLYEVSFPRGDSSFTSVLPYFSNTKRIKDKLEKRLDELLTSQPQTKQENN